MDTTPPKGKSPGYPDGYLKYEDASDDDWEIQVDIRGEAYTGPEAMQLDRVGRSTVVWS